MENYTIKPIDRSTFANWVSEASKAIQVFRYYGIITQAQFDVCTQRINSCIVWRNGANMVESVPTNPSVIRTIRGYSVLYAENQNAIDNWIETHGDIFEIGLL